MSFEKGKYCFINNDLEVGKIGNMKEYKNIQTNQKVYRKEISVKEGSDKYNQCKITTHLIQQIKHENLVEIIDVYEEQGYIHIYMEKYENNLKQLIENNTQLFLNIESLKDFIRQIINGYCMLMEFQIIHRDLKPQNILCKKNKENKQIYKISDFGFSKVIDLNKEHDMTCFQEKSYYQAPDLIDDEYTNKCDVYSFGLIIAESIAGNKQFNEKEKKELPNSLNMLKQHSSEEIINLLKSMLIKDQQQRISWTQLKLQFFYPNYKEGFEKHQQNRVADINGRFVWIKQISKKYNGGFQNEIEEININLKFKQNKEQNDNIIKVFEVLNEKDYDFAYLIMENCDGDLKQLREKQGIFKFEQIVEFLQQLNNGYLFLIRQEIVHRDLKPENILYCQTNKNKICYKIGDFQYSFDQKSKKKSASSKTGTSLYQAPEVNGNNEYDNKCDIYSLGMIILQISSDLPNLTLVQINNIKKRLKSNECILEILQDPSYGCNISIIDEKTKELIKQMIKHNPKNRISWEELNNQINMKQLNQNPQQKYSQFNQQQQQVTLPLQQNFLSIPQQQKTNLLIGNQQINNKNDKQQFNVFQQILDKNQSKQNGIQQKQQNNEHQNRVIPNCQVQSLNNNNHNNQITQGKINNIFNQQGQNQVEQQQPNNLIQNQQQKFYFSEFKTKPKQQALNLNNSNHTNQLISSTTNNTLNQQVQKGVQSQYTNNQQQIKQRESTKPNQQALNLSNNKNNNNTNQFTPITTNNSFNQQIQKGVQSQQTNNQFQIKQQIQQAIPNNQQIQNNTPVALQFNQNLKQSNQNEQNDISTKINQNNIVMNLNPQNKNQFPNFQQNNQGKFEVNRNQLFKGSLINHQNQ